MKKSKNKIIDGCCGGLAEEFGIDPLWVRLFFAVGGFVFIYVVMMICMDE